MKCVCPMGGDRTCPDDCPLALWAGLSSSDRAAQRKTIAEKLYKQGFTMAQIATQLGVSEKTISLDLILTQGKNSSRAKTATNPKGAGRPKGAQNRKPAPYESAKAQAAAQTVLDEGRDMKEAAIAAGFKSDTPIRAAVAMEKGRREVEATLDVPLTERQQQLLEREQRRREAEFERRVNAAVRLEVERHFNEYVIPTYGEKLRKADDIMDYRKMPFTNAQYLSLLASLHPDTSSPERRHDAFILVKEKEHVLRPKQPDFKLSDDLPKTVAELIARRRASR